MTLRGYEYAMALDDKHIALLMLWLFHRLVVFHCQWPLFILIQKCEEARLVMEQHGEVSDPLPPAARLWGAAYNLLQDAIIYKTDP